MMLRRLALASVLLIASSAAPAMASTATASLNVSATVGAVCTISAGTLAFGAYDSTLTTDNDNTANIITNCTTGVTSPMITLDNGVNVTGTQRRLKGQGPTDYLNYNLYSDSGRTVAWTTTGVPTGASGTNQNNTVYGRIPASQTTAAVGSYTDTVTATITY